MLGANGRGTAEAQGCRDGVGILFSSFTKALKSLGGFIAARHSVIRHLRYNLRSHIFSRSMPLAILRGLAERFRVMPAERQGRETLRRNARQLQRGRADAGLDIATQSGGIDPVHLHGDEIAAIRLVEMLREDFGLFAYAVTYPVIQKGKVRVRLVPTAAHFSHWCRNALRRYLRCRKGCRRALVARLGLRLRRRPCRSALPGWKVRRTVFCLKGRGP